jgi:glycosyltransferase involved in cell wall biosynthesis
VSDGNLPFVSIVVPARNAKDDIDRLIGSLKSLDWPNDRLERIVVDDASTDDTATRANQPGMIVVRQAKRGGSYAARNVGTKAAKGDWIAFTDADCAPRPDWLRVLLAEPIQPDTGALVGEVLALETSTAAQRFIESRGFMKHAVTLPHKVLPGFSTANVAIRRNLLKRLNGFREDVLYFGDMELSWRMQIEQNARLDFRPGAVVLHRHRRTVGALWRQAVQHGRGVAFMKRTYPDVYRISPSEQLRRVGGIAGAAGSAATGGGSDAWLAPGFLALWYAGMLAGYVRGPAWVRT